MHSYDFVREWALKGSVEIDDVASREKWEIFGKQDDVLTDMESEWGLSMTSGNGGKNWSGILCEELVKETLIRNGHNVITSRKLHGYHPDIETDEFVYEVKGMRYFMSGTACEKVQGVPYKYADIPEIYGKPLKIVCVAYQEWISSYGKNGQRIFGDIESSNRRSQLDLWKSQGIEFIRYSQLN